MPKDQFQFKENWGKPSKPKRFVSRYPIQHRINERPPGRPENQNDKDKLWKMDGPGLGESKFNDIENNRPTDLPPWYEREYNDWEESLELNQPSFDNWKPDWDIEQPDLPLLEWKDVVWTPIEWEDVDYEWKDPEWKDPEVPQWENPTAPEPPDYEDDWEADPSDPELPHAELSDLEFPDLSQVTFPDGHTVTKAPRDYPTPYVIPSVYPRQVQRGTFKYMGFVVQLMDEDGKEVTVDYNLVVPFTFGGEAQFGKDKDYIRFYGSLTDDVTSPAYVVPGYGPSFYIPKGQSRGYISCMILAGTQEVRDLTLDITLHLKRAVNWKVPAKPIYTKVEKSYGYGKYETFYDTGFKTQPESNATEQSLKEEIAELEVSLASLKSQWDSAASVSQGAVGKANSYVTEIIAPLQQQGRNKYLEIKGYEGTDQAELDALVGELDAIKQAIADAFEVHKQLIADVTPFLEAEEEAFYNYRSALSQIEQLNLDAITVTERGANVDITSVSGFIVPRLQSAEIGGSTPTPPPYTWEGDPEALVIVRGDNTPSYLLARILVAKDLSSNGFKVSAAISSDGILSTENTAGAADYYIPPAPTPKEGEEVSTYYIDGTPGGEDYQITFVVTSADLGSQPQPEYPTEEEAEAAPIQHFIQVPIYGTVNGDRREDEIIRLTFTPLPPPATNWFKQEEAIDNKTPENKAPDPFDYWYSLDPVEFFIVARPSTVTTSVEVISPYTHEFEEGQEDDEIPRIPEGFPQPLVARLTLFFGNKTAVPSNAFLGEPFILQLVLSGTATPFLDYSFPSANYLSDQQDFGFLVPPQYDEEKQIITLEIPEGLINSEMYEVIVDIPFDILLDEEDEMGTEEEPLPGESLVLAPVGELQVIDGETVAIVPNTEPVGFYRWATLNDLTAYIIDAGEKLEYIFIAKGIFDTIKPTLTKAVVKVETIDGQQTYTFDGESALTHTTFGSVVFDVSDPSNTGKYLSVVVGTGAVNVYRVSYSGVPGTANAKATMNIGAYDGICRPVYRTSSAFNNTSFVDISRGTTFRGLPDLKGMFVFGNGKYSVRVTTDPDWSNIFRTSSFSYFQTNLIDGSFLGFLDDYGIGDQTVGSTYYVVGQFITTTINEQDEAEVNVSLVKYTDPTIKTAGNENFDVATGQYIAFFVYNVLPVVNTARQDVATGAGTEIRVVQRFIGEELREETRYQHKRNPSYPGTGQSEFIFDKFIDKISQSNFVEDLPLWGTSYLMNKEGEIIFAVDSWELESVTYALDENFIENTSYKNYSLDPLHRVFSDHRYVIAGYNATSYNRANDFHVPGKFSYVGFDFAREFALIRCYDSETGLAYASKHYSSTNHLIETEYTIGGIAKKVETINERLGEEYPHWIIMAGDGCALYFDQYYGFDDINDTSVVEYRPPSGITAYPHYTVPTRLRYIRDGRAKPPEAVSQIGETYTPHFIIGTENYTLDNAEWMGICTHSRISFGTVVRVPGEGVDPNTETTKDKFKLTNLATGVVGVWEWSNNCHYEHVGDGFKRLASWDYYDSSTGTWKPISSTTATHPYFAIPPGYQVDDKYIYDNVRNTLFDDIRNARDQFLGIFQYKDPVTNKWRLSMSKGTLTGDTVPAGFAINNNSNWPDLTVAYNCFTGEFQEDEKLLDLENVQLIGYGSKTLIVNLDDVGFWLHYIYWHEEWQPQMIKHYDEKKKRTVLRMIYCTRPVTSSTGGVADYDYSQDQLHAAITLEFDPNTKKTTLHSIKKGLLAAIGDVPSLGSESNLYATDLNSLWK